MVLGFLFGWDWKVRRMRKKWDRLREKALKKEEPIKHMALEKLDTIENHLRILEEQRVSRVDRARFSKEIQIDLSGIKSLLKSKPEEVGTQREERETRY